MKRKKSLNREGPNRKVSCSNRYESESLHWAYILKEIVDIDAQV